jgi:acetoin utilization protein AcuB
MLVEDYMTPNPITVGEDISVMEVAELMKRNGVWRFPVMRGNELVGVITDRDVRSAAPSQVVNFDERERTLLPDLYEYLTKITVKDVMARNLVVISPKKSLITASLMMLKHKVTGLPVVDEKEKLIGILTQGDIFKALVDFSAGDVGKALFGLKLEDRPSVVKEVSGVITGHGARIASIISSPIKKDKQFRNVYIRLMDQPSVNLKALRTDLAKKYEVLFLIEDDGIIH